MVQKYEKLLEELGILSSAGSYEVGRQLKEKKNELKLSMTSRQSEEENKKIEQKIHAIQEAEAYFEKLFEKEKKEDKSDDFDYSFFQNMENRKPRTKYVVSVETHDVDDVQDEENALSFEERYDNIIGYMGTPDGFADGLKQLEQLAEDGYVVAQRRVGDIYFDGEKGIDADINKTVYWFEKAAAQGDDKACFELGYIYGNEREVKDVTKAFYWYKKGAEAGNIYACNSLGVYYQNGIGTEKSITEAIKWYEKAAEAGHILAYYNLGLTYKDELKDKKKTFYWYKKAAEAGNSSAYNYLGECYYNGIGTGKNITEAIKWYENAVETGDILSYGKLGKIYEDYENDDAKAFYWYKKGAEAGDKDCFNSLGKCYMYGIGTKIDNIETIKWYKKAVAAGKIDAIYELGQVYGLIGDKEKAFRCFKIGAEAEDDDCCYALAEHYYEGEGTKKNITEAIKWYERAAEEEFIPAYWKLGYIYENEDEDEVKDLIKAYYWYEKAADEGNSDAMYKLGHLCENNFLNKAEAEQWYSKAANKGNKEAKKAFDRLSGK